MKVNPEENQYTERKKDREWRPRKGRGRKGRKKRGRRVGVSYQPEYVKYVPKRSKKRRKQTWGSGQSKEEQEGSSNEAKAETRKEQSQMAQEDLKKSEKGDLGKREENGSEKGVEMTNDDRQTEESVKVDKPKKEISKEGVVNLAMSPVPSCKKLEKRKSMETFPSEGSNQRSRDSKLSLMLTPLQIKEKRESAKGDKDAKSNFKMWNEKKLFDSECSSANTDLSEPRNFKINSAENKKSRKPQPAIILKTFMTPISREQKSRPKTKTKIGTGPKLPSLLKCSFQEGNFDNSCQERDLDGLSQCFLNSKYYNSQSGSENGKRTLSSFNSQTLFSKNVLTSFSNQTLSSTQIGELESSKDKLPQIFEQDAGQLASGKSDNLGEDMESSEDLDEMLCRDKLGNLGVTFEHRTSTFENESGLKGGFCLMNLAEDRFLKSSENRFNTLLQSDSRISGLNLMHRVTLFFTFET